MTHGQKPFIEIMKRLGWRKMGGDGRYTQLGFALADRTIVAFCNFARLPDKYKFSCEPGVAFERFRLAYDYVASGKTTGELIRREPRYAPVYTSVLSPEFLRSQTDQLIGWAKSIDPEMALQEVAAPRAGWSNDHRHLAAVALMGNIALLRHYVELRERENAVGGSPREPDMSESANLSFRCSVADINLALDIAEGRHPTLGPGMPMK